MQAWNGGRPFDPAGEPPHIIPLVCSPENVETPGRDCASPVEAQPQHKNKIRGRARKGKAFPQGGAAEGSGVICIERVLPTSSFPRKRESTPQTSGNALSRDWIPAFSGMTAYAKGRLLQMTPTPGGAARQGKPR